MFRLMVLVFCASLLAACASQEQSRDSQQYARFLRQRVIDTRVRAETAASADDAVRWLNLHDRYANALNDYLLRREQSGGATGLRSVGSAPTPRDGEPPTCGSILIDSRIKTSCY